MNYSREHEATLLPSLCVSGKHAKFHLFRAVIIQPLLSVAVDSVGASEKQRDIWAVCGFLTTQMLSVKLLYRWSVLHQPQPVVKLDVTQRSQVVCWRQAGGIGWQFFRVRQVNREARLSGEGQFCEDTYWAGVWTQKQIWSRSLRCRSQRGGTRRSCAVLHL